MKVRTRPGRWSPACSECWPWHVLIRHLSLYSLDNFTHCLCIHASRGGSPSHRARVFTSHLLIAATKPSKHEGVEGEAVQGGTGGQLIQERGGLLFVFHYYHYYYYFSGSLDKYKSTAYRGFKTAEPESCVNMRRGGFHRQRYMCLVNKRQESPLPFH